MLQHFVVGDPGTNQMYVTVFIPGHGFESADSAHPMYAKIVEAAAAGDAEAVLNMVDVGKSVTMAVADANLSSRVEVRDGTLYLDEMSMDGALADHILKLLAEKNGDLTAWVRFLERIEANTNEHSREMLFTWLRALGETDGGFTTTSDGLLVGFKGVRKNSDGSLVSVNNGPGIVNGVETSGHLANDPGNVVEMKRSDVQHDPSIGCSRGLHVGTYAYASDWAQGAVVEVHVDPADVVSVPTDCNAQKMRCAKYKVIREIEAPYSSAVLDDEVEDHDDFRVDFDDIEERDDEYTGIDNLPEGIDNDGPNEDDDADEMFCGQCFDGDDTEKLDDGTVVCWFDGCHRVVYEANENA